VSAKHLVISSYSDLSKLSPEAKCVHFRKFVSKRLLKKVLCKFKKIERISLSKYAFSRCNAKLIEIVTRKKLEIKILERNAGRPNLIEKGSYNLIKPNIVK